jgi:hypothetical protein
MPTPPFGQPLTVVGFGEGTDVDANLRTEAPAEAPATIRAKRTRNMT